MIYRARMYGLYVDRVAQPQMLLHDNLHTTQGEAETAAKTLLMDDKLRGGYIKRIEIRKVTVESFHSTLRIFSHHSMREGIPLTHREARWWEHELPGDKT